MHYVALAPGERREAVLPTESSDLRIIMKAAMMGLLVLVCCSGGPLGVVQAQCSCTDASLCQPLSTPPAGREVFAFFTGNWTNLNFSTMTTAAAFSAVDPQLVCHAHSLGVRVVRSAPFDVSRIENSTARSDWVASQLASIKAAGLDGLNLDIEGYKGDPKPLTALVTELYTSMKAWNAHSQLSFDLSIFPDGQSAHYNHKDLAKVLDFIVPMACEFTRPVYRIRHACPWLTRTVVGACPQTTNRGAARWRPQTHPLKTSPKGSRSTLPQESRLANL